MTKSSVNVDESQKKIKCVVWDLDNTLWDGVLLEDDQVKIRQDVVEVIKVLDSRGILQSIASKNDYESANSKLVEFGLDDFFLYPQISWNPKSSSIKKIASSINIGIDTFAFVDDQPFELDEVKFTHPDVLCIDAADISGLLDMPEMNPRFITDDSKIRRSMYMSDIERKQQEETFEGTTEEFLASLDMCFKVFPATEDDLERAEELTIRTHQLNTTGYTYSYEELNQLRCSNDHLLLVASLDDRYGSYGKIGLALVETKPDVWRLKLLLMSCRVMSRGVGSIMINEIMRAARDAGAALEAEYIPTDVNRMMYLTYKFGSFNERETSENRILFEADLSRIPNNPDYLKIQSGIVSK